MKGLLVIAAAAMSKEALVDLLEEAVEEFKKDPTDENFKKVAMPALMVTTKASIIEKGGDSTEAAIEMIQELDRTGKASKLLDSEEN